MLKRKYITARAIIVDNARVLLFYRERYDTKQQKLLRYFSIPGGKLERRESPEAAVHRELQEELGVEVELLAPIPLAHGVGARHEHYIFWAKITRGEPALQNDSEEYRRQVEGKNTYELRWVSVDELTTENMYFYQAYVPLIQQIVMGKIPKQTVAFADETLV